MSFVAAFRVTGPLSPLCVARYSAPSCDARVALDGFVHRRRLASRSRQLAAAQPGCASLDPHATCSEARPQGLATDSTCDSSSRIFFPTPRPSFMRTRNLRWRLLAPS